MQHACICFEHFNHDETFVGQNGVWWEGYFREIRRDNTGSDFKILHEVTAGLRPSWCETEAVGLSDIRRGR